MFIVIEGIDSVGKSSLIKQLCQHPDWTNIQSPRTSVRAHKSWMDRFASPKLHYLFYSKCMRDLSEDVRLTEGSHRFVIADRYWYSTVATHRTLGVSCGEEEFAMLRVPDRVLHLTASEEVRMERMKKRGLDPNDVRMLGKSAEALNNFRELLPEGTIEIDTSTISIEQTCEICLGYVYG